MNIKKFSLMVSSVMLMLSLSTPASAGLFDKIAQYFTHSQTYDLSSNSNRSSAIEEEYPKLYLTQHTEIELKIDAETSARLAVSEHEADFADMFNAFFINKSEDHLVDLGRKALAAENISALERLDSLSFAVIKMGFDLQPINNHTEKSLAVMANLTKILNGKYSIIDLIAGTDNAVDIQNIVNGN